MISKIYRSCSSSFLTNLSCVKLLNISDRNSWNPFAGTSKFNDLLRKNTNSYQMTSAKDSMKQVILCKGIAENNDTHDDYIETMQSAGYICYHLPTLRFEYVNLDKLKECLLLPNLYRGLIVTSRRTVEAIHLALHGNRLPDRWKELPVYCVGPATTSLVESNLKLTNCMGSECGNAKDLANYIVQNLPKDTRPLLYPCSVIARDTIERVLDDNQIGVKKLCVYNTLPTETLETDLERVINESQQIFVFFSPSTVEYILNAARQKEHILDKIQAVAIGPSSAEALEKAGIKLQAVSSKPEPNALLQAIQLAGL